MAHPQRAKSRLRNASGLAVTVLVLIMAIFIVGVLGVFGFEVSRTDVAREELQHVCTAAALAGAVGLPNPYMYMDPQTMADGHDDASTTHDRAESAAQQIFISNSILNTFLSDTTFSDNRQSSAEETWRSRPDGGTAKLYVEFLKPDGSVAAWNDPNIENVHVVGAFGVIPSFARYCGIGNVVVYADAKAPAQWVHTFHADWQRTTDPMLAGTFWQTSGWGTPNASVVNGYLNVPELPSTFVQTANPSGANTGFSQRYGYFQMVAKLSGHAWGGMALMVPNSRTVQPEIDVNETFGGQDNAYWATLHSDMAHAGDQYNINHVVTQYDLSQGFHSYGVMWLPKDPKVYFFFDGKVVASPPKYSSTDLEPLAIFVGMGVDTLYNSSTGGEPDDQWKSIDAWELASENNAQNVINPNVR